MMHEYRLPQEWIDHLATQPESGMGYQVVDIHFSDDVLRDIPVTNCQVFWHDDDSLNLDDIVDIEVNKNFSPFGKWYP